MNEPKKRGRPAKNVIGNFAGGVGKPVPDVIQFYDAREVALIKAEMRQGIEIAAITPDEVAADIWNGVKVMLTTSDTERAVAQAYALRVWNGQSITADRKWRIARVMEALEGQNLPTDGIELP